MREQSAYSGRLLETDIVGKKQPPTKEYLGLLAQKRADNGYVDFINSMNFAREVFKGDPTNPEKDLPRDLLIDLRDRFGLEDDDGDRFKFYSALGTPLDVLHGADGWFEFDNPRGRKVYVTIDVTQNAALALTGEKSKADLVIVDTTDKRLVGRIDVFKKDFGESRVAYCPVSDPTADGYIEALDLLAEELEKIFKAKGIIAKAA